ncbi:hypothetical protein [uncultured Phocaeicola sp.]|jgi:hypothetical protein|uniref:hypothetical protein n=1 Tax=uncultured Phocaeicola sp. TaxID=990718 RepID=UPI0025F23483|nr:hypothetical protein [uncultured Phocaeicola sp.]
MPEFSPVFVQKIFCFVQIPESFVQKHTTATGETEENIEDFFSKQADKSRFTQGKGKAIGKIK